MTSVSGMAASIRAATESETFDFAGSNKSTVITTIQSAFTEPLPLTDMIRITFITGAGKLGRSRYDENCHKNVTSTLRDLGYVEDRGASCVVECAGSFKSQHDTGKNLKTIVVFPKIFDESAIGNLNVDGDVPEMNSPPLIEKSSPKHMIAMSSMQVFTRMIASKCPSWSQKKVCAKNIGEVKNILEELEKKLLAGIPFNDIEQEFYDDVSIDSLSQKEQLVRTEMQKQVEEGRITALEKSKLLNQVQEKIDALQKGIAEAKQDSKPKKVEKLTLQMEKANERKKKISAITGINTYPLKNEREIGKLRKEMQPLLRLERETKGRLLSLKETTVMSRKDEIEEEIRILEEQSRGWFEEDDEFQVRVEVSRAASKTSVAKQKVSAKKNPGQQYSTVKSGKKAVANWVVPTTRNTRTVKATNRKSAQSNNVFSAMMMDSDSD